MKSTGLIIAMLLLGSFSSFADAPPGTIKQIAPGVWFREGDASGGTGLCNNIIIEMRDDLIVVDANYPSGAQEVIRDAKKLSPKPIKFVIDTHWHPDHAYGNHLFTEIGATTIAYIGAYEQIKRWEPQFWQHVEKQRKDLAEFHLSGPEPPELYYTRSPYVISDGTRRVELYHFGWGHTRSDTFVYLPKEKILCTGDAVVNGPYSDPKNAYMLGWIKEIRAAQRLSVKYVLPGHGDPGGPELLSGELRFFLALYGAVETAIKKGETLDQLVTMKDGRAVSTTIKLPQDLMDVYVFKPSPDLKLWERSRFPTQVMDTYLEITQHKPYGMIDDPYRAW
jgi:cyclase